MARPQRKRAPAPAKPDAPALTPEQLQRTFEQAVQTVLDNTQVDARPPSVQAATPYRVNVKNYTKHETAAAQHAMDWAGNSASALTFTENTGFPGFPTLSLLSQLSEYRNMASALAEDVIRKWGRVTSSGKSDDAKCQQLEAELKRMNVRAHVKTAVEHDQLFGGAHVYFKLKGDEDSRALPLVLRPFTVQKGSFEGLRVIEPYWVTPNFYNSIDPTAADFYKPSSWWLLGTLTHSTRMETLISRPVPDMLKPAYSFRGISLTQLAMPYVDNWLRTRQSVSDTVKQFSVSGVLTDLQQMLLPGAAQSMANRAELLNRFRDNRNILFLDKATEEFFQVNTPLSGLDALQAQSQEQMSSVAQQPLVKLTGITPSGLNASSDGEIRVWYDRVGGYQNNVVGPLMLSVLRLSQLSLFGQIDEDIAWEWDPLHAMNELEQADVALKEADTDARYIEAGVIIPDVVRKRLATDPNSLYAAMDDDDLDAIPDNDVEAITEKILEIGTDPAPVAEPGGLPTDLGLPEGAQAGVAQQLEASPADGAPAAHAAQLAPTPEPYSLDEAWKEGDHPRAKNGQFGEGGSAATGKKKVSLTPNERSAVSSYSGDNFVRVNAALRSGDASDPEVGRIDSAISKNTVPPGTTLYRGMTREAAKQLFGGSIERGATISDKAYASTSVSRNEASARALGGVMLKIETGANAQGLDMSELSRNKGEQETLLPRNAKMVIQGVTAPKNPADPIVVRVRYGD